VAFLNAGAFAALGGEDIGVGGGVGVRRRNASSVNTTRPIWPPASSRRLSAIS
jgi:hypothetical protein